MLNLTLPFNISHQLLHKTRNQLDVWLAFDMENATKITVDLL